MTLTLATQKAVKIDHVETGKRIRHARKEAGISLRTLAIHMQISAPFLSDMELGRRHWSQERFELAKRLIEKQKTRK